MHISQNCFNLLEKFECGGNIDNYLTAYLCPAGKWTIGMGNTFYANGNPIKHGDILTHQQAIDLFNENIIIYENIVNKAVKSKLNQNQFDALVSFVYNVPESAFEKSTLLRMINLNPNNPDIGDEWMKWVYFTNPKTGRKQASSGLVNRRAAESKLYFN